MCIKIILITSPIRRNPSRRSGGWPLRGHCQSERRGNKSGRVFRLSGPAGAACCFVLIMIPPSVFRRVNNQRAFALARGAGVEPAGSSGTSLYPQGCVSPPRYLRISESAAHPRFAHQIRMAALRRSADLCQPLIRKLSFKPVPSGLWCLPFCLPSAGSAIPRLPCAPARSRWPVSAPG